MLIILATAAAGIAGYVVTWVVPRVIGGVDYKVFAVFWAAMYLVVTALSGVQQEVTRATGRRAVGSPPGRNVARNFGAGGALGVFAVVLLTAPLWVRGVFPELGWALVFPLAVGTASYVVLATLSGTLYGVSEWRPLSWLIVTDAMVRLVAVGVVSVISGDLVALAWAAALPFGATVAALWPAIRRHVAGRSELDVGYRSLGWNVSRTLLASASAGALVSGFPLLLSLTSHRESPALLASLFLTITLTRAPLIVTIMAVQGYLIVRFRDNPARLTRDLRQFLLAIVGGAVVLAGLGWALGPTVFGWLFPGEPVLDGWFFAVLIGSSALVGALSITAPAVLARGQHAAYSAGWVVAALVTVAALLVPTELMARIILALILGPIAGLSTHLVFLFGRRRPRESARSDAVKPSLTSP